MKTRRPVSVRCPHPASAAPAVLAALALLSGLDCPASANSSGIFQIGQAGLTDAAHTAANGSQRAVAFTNPFTDSGYLFGVSEQLGSNQTANVGTKTTAWVYDVAAGTTSAIGFDDSEHSLGDGTRHSYFYANEQNGSGRYLFGYSLASTTTGASPWIYDAVAGTLQPARGISPIDFVSGFIEPMGARYRTSSETGYAFVGNIYEAYLASAFSPASVRSPAIRIQDIEGDTAVVQRRVAFFDEEILETIEFYVPFVETPARTAAMGLADSEHFLTNPFGTGNNGYISDFRNDGEQGRIHGSLVAGASQRAEGGWSAWVADLSNFSDSVAIQRLGFTDLEHTRADGYRFSNVGQVTASGFARGRSERFSGMIAAGQTAWVANALDGTTFEVGFYGPEFTRADGLQLSQTAEVTESGFVRGFSQRFNGADPVGRVVWIWDSATLSTTAYGFYDAEHTGSNNEQYSQFGDLTESGFARGFSNRYSGSSSAGRTPWLADAHTGATSAVGFFDGDHTRADGFRSGFASDINEAGYAVGTSARYLGAADGGLSAWVANAATGVTTRVGLAGPDYTRADGFQFSRPYGMPDLPGNLTDGLTESGFAIGISHRFNGNQQVGQTAWVHSIMDDLTTELLFSSRSTDGFAFSEIHGVLETGFVFGLYRLFDASTDDDLGLRPFIWSPSLGPLDVTDSVNGGIAGHGWASLDLILSANSNGTIVGYGTRIGQEGTDGRSIFVLTPIASIGRLGFAPSTPIPEPSVAFLIAPGFALLAARRRR